MSDDYDFDEFTPEDFAAIDAEVARAHGGPAVQIVIEDSPFHKFLSWKKYLAVTDLVSPVWCEVQYEYSLYGRRHKPLHLRPSAFTSKSGKEICVDQQVAQAHDRRLKRGKSIHKALEDELHPDRVIVRITSEEERFGLRLLQLIDGFNQLLSDGIARELPVFAVTHAQVVLGVIDEVLRLPLIQTDQDQAISPRSPSSIPSGSPPNKKERLLSSLTQQQITPVAVNLSTAMNTVCEVEPTNLENPYELRIIDYKTRRSSNIPLDEDSLSSRLQLMMYHRMLSSLLEPESFDFDLLWSRLDLNPTKPFSPQFLKETLWRQRQTNPEDCNVHLNRLVTEWISTVQRSRTGLMGVSQQLQIVYRQSMYGGKREKAKHKVTETTDTDHSLEALAFQEELDLARAIEESLNEMGHQEAVHRVAQTAKQVRPSSAVSKDPISPLDCEQIDPILAWTFQESLLDCIHKAHGPVTENNAQQADINHDDVPFDESEPVMITSREQVQAETTLHMSHIIGKKEFRMNDEELDAHIADILQWWFGTRPPRGVDAGHTNRCFTCEYQGSCEWREQKAEEALASNKYRNTIWPTTPPTA